MGRARPGTGHRAVAELVRFRRRLGHGGHPASGDRREPGPGARDSAGSAKRAGPTSGPRRL
jgi:hypothetical protein